MSRLGELIERDGGACLWCGHEPWRSDLTVEHLLPRSRGGRGTPENLAVACRRCNRNRGSQPPVAYLRSLRERGAEPRAERLRAALRRLAGSGHREHVRFAGRQLELLDALERRAGIQPGLIF